MVWVLYALVAMFLLSIIGLCDKYLVVNKIKDQYLNTVLIGFSGICGSLFILLADFHYDHWKYLLSALLGGILFIVSHIPYFKALYNGEVSRLTSLWQFIPLFLLILSALFLNDIFKPVHYLAFFLLISGGLLISLEPGTFVLNKGFWYMIVSSLGFALSFFFQDVGYSYINFWLTFSLIMSGLVIGSTSILLCSFNTRKHFLSFLKSNDRLLQGVVIFKIPLSIAAFLSFNYAISLGNIALVYATEAVYPVMLLFETTFISLFFPKFIKEELSWKIFSQKFFYILIISAGAVLLAVN